MFFSKQDNFTLLLNEDDSKKLNDILQQQAKLESQAQDNVFIERSRSFFSRLARWFD